MTATSKEIAARFGLLTRATVGLFVVFCLALAFGQWTDRTAQVEISEIQDAESSVSRLGEAISYSSMLVSGGLTGDLDSLDRVAPVLDGTEQILDKLQVEYSQYIDADVLADLRVQQAHAKDIAAETARVWQALGPPGTSEGQRVLVEQAANDLAGEISTVADNQLRLAFSELRRIEFSSPTALTGDAANRLPVSAAKLKSEVDRLGLPEDRSRSVKRLIDQYTTQLRALLDLYGQLAVLNARHNSELSDYFTNTQKLERDIQTGEARVLADVTFQRNVSLALTWIPVLATLGIVLTTIARAQRTLTTNDRNIRRDGDRFKDFARASSDVFWESDREGRLTFAEGLESFPAAFGAEQLLGKKITDIFRMYGVNDQRVTGYIARCMDAGQAFRNITFATTVTGTTAWRRASAVPIFDDDGAFLGMRGALVDASAEVDVTRENESLLNRARAAAMAHHENMFVIDQNGRIDTVEGPDAELIETHIRKIGTRSLREYLRSIESTPVREPKLLKAIETNTPFSNQVARARSFKSGQLEFFRVSGAPIWGQNDVPEGYVFVAHNINREYSAESELREKERMMACIVENTPAAFYSFTVLADGRYRVNHLPSRFAWVFGLQD
ncbi:MAG: PAS domain-containing protein, partial [Rhodobacteraceae bacterium]|nr:PAS domain-containing protein [Paracoccaceae bacterium]